MARLIVNPDSADAWEIVLRSGTNSLGRSAENDFQIEHFSVSSSHCQIQLSGRNALLKDIGSTNGTFIDGRLVEQARLQSGQVFCLGDVRLRFETESMVEPIPATVSQFRQPQPTGASPKLQAQGKRRFAVRVCGAFLYPLAKDGVLLLVTGTIFLSIIEAGRFFARFVAVKGIGMGSIIGLAFLVLLTSFASGYLTCYLRRVVTGTAMSEPGAPDWPDLSDFATDVFSPLIQLVVTVLACLTPAIIVGMFVGVDRTGQTVLWIGYGLGGFYFPMAFLAVAMFDSLAALNPLLIVPSILKVLGSYLVTVVLLGAVLAAKWCGDYFLPKLIPIPIVPSVIAILVGLYFLMVEARVLGLLYLVNKDRLAWFGHH